MDHKKFAIDIAKQAGQIIMANFKLGMKKEWKEDTTPLTETDSAIDELFRKSVKKHFPLYGIISEENDNHLPNAEYTWICDPVDGTTPFSHGIPACTFMLALVKNGQSILGVVYDPFLDRLYFAEKGKGATLNNKPIKVSNNNVLNKSVIGIICWKDSGYDFAQIKKTLISSDIHEINLLSVGYMDALVAAGELSAVIFADQEPWDSAAPKIIVEEAGGKFTDLFGNEPKFNGKVKGHLATNSVLYEKLLKIIKESL